jgi:hypothetical protein
MLRRSPRIAAMTTPSAERERNARYYAHIMARYSAETARYYAQATALTAETAKLTAEYTTTPVVPTTTSVVPTTTPVVLTTTPLATVRKLRRSARIAAKTTPSAERARNARYYAHVIAVENARTARYSAQIAALNTKGHTSDQLMHE